jgi:hypothetical protein
VQGIFVTLQVQKSYAAREAFLSRVSLFFAVLDDAGFDGAIRAEEPVHALWARIQVLLLVWRDLAIFLLTLDLLSEAETQRGALHENLLFVPAFGAGI